MVLKDIVEGCGILNFLGIGINELTDNLIVNDHQLIPGSQTRRIYFGDRKG